MLVEYVTEVRPRVETMPRRAGADAQQHGGGLQAAVTPHLQPVVPADGKRTDGAFGGPIVDVEPRVVEVADKRRPLVARVLDRLTEQAFLASPGVAARRASH